jgi:hypothetical protein
MSEPGSLTVGTSPTRLGEARIEYSIEGKFFVDPRGVGRWTGASGEEMPNGPDRVWFALAPGVHLDLADGCLPEEFDFVDLNDESLHLGEIYGVSIFCKSSTCAQAALRHRRAPPLVGKILLQWNGGGRYKSFVNLVVPSALRRETLAARRSGFDIRSIPAQLRCSRCRGEGALQSVRVVEANGQVTS